MHTWTESDIRDCFSGFRSPSEADALIKTVHRLQEGAILECLKAILDAHLDLVCESILSQEFGEDDGFKVEGLDQKTYEQLRLVLAVLLDNYIWREQRRRQKQLSDAETRALWRRKSQRDRKWLIAALTVLIWTMFFRRELRAQGRYVERHEPEDEGGREAGGDMEPRPRKDDDDLPEPTP